MRSYSLVIAAAAAFVSACSVNSEGGSIGEQLGVTAGAPDEFLIIARKPLEMPASMTLTRPEPGAPSRVDPNPFHDAHASLYREKEPRRLSAPSGGETTLLAGADASGDNSVIRQVLAEDNPDDVERKYGLTSFLGVPIPADFGAEEDSVVTPVAETQLLRRQGYLTPTAPEGLADDEPPPPGFFSSRGVPTEEEIEASRDPN